MAGAVARSRATPAAVFSLLKNSDTWPRWSLFNSSEVERTGNGEHFGVGAIRTFSTRVSKTTEQVTELIPDQKLSYVLLSGLPLRNYQAVVQLSSPEFGVTLVNWTASFQCRYGTGWFWRIFLNLILSRVAMQLAAAAEKLEAVGFLKSEISISPTQILTHDASDREISGQLRGGSRDRVHDRRIGQIQCNS